MVTESVKGKDDGPNNVERATEILSTYGDFIRSIIQFRIKSEALCDDLFQDFFLQLVSKPIPDNVRNMRGFLFRLITDRIKDSVRSIARYQKRQLRGARNRENIVYEGPEKEIIDKEEFAKMMEVIRKRLSTQEASAIFLRHKKGYEIKEIAEKLGVNSRSASRYISVGLKKTREFLCLEKGR